MAKGPFYKEKLKRVASCSVFFCFLLFCCVLLKERHFDIVPQSRHCLHCLQQVLPVHYLNLYYLNFRTERESIIIGITVL